MLIARSLQRRLFSSTVLPKLLSTTYLRANHQKHEALVRSLTMLLEKMQVLHATTVRSLRLRFLGARAFREPEDSPAKPRKGDS